jgi:exosome complex component RRP4
LADFFVQERKWEKDYYMAEKEKIIDNSKERKIVVPGEIIVSGEDFLPGEGVRREENDIIASRYGLTDISDRFVKIIPLSGSYNPRKGNAIIGEVVDITSNGWVVDFGGSSNGFLPLSEVPRYINKNEMKEHFDFKDLIVCKVWDVKSRGVDLSVKMRGFGKIKQGIIIKINPNKVPRVIGKEGSMVNLIKESTGCDITVGQNGWVWIKGKEIEDELKTKKIIEFICENSFISGLTEKVENFIKKEIK